MKGLRSFFSFRRLPLWAAVVGACAIAFGVVSGAGAAPAATGTCTYEEPIATSFVFEPAAPKVGEQVTFTSTSATTNSDGDPVVEEWDLNNDGVIDGTGHQVTFTYTAPGDYLAQLRTTSPPCDNFGFAARDVHVQAQPTTSTTTTSPPPDTTAPGLGTLGLSATVFRAAKSGPSTSARPIGTRVSYSLSEPGSVKFTVDRKTRGRKVGSRCKAQTRSNRTRKACIRWVKVKGSFTVAGKAGTNRFKFRGRIGGRALRPGSYRLNGRASDAAKNKSKLKRRAFRIVR